MATVDSEEGYTRYSVITEKNAREIVMLRGNGCKWRRCRFCDYHIDFSLDEEKNFLLNTRLLNMVKGTYGVLEIINSGSFCDLDSKTVDYIIQTCHEKNIKEVSFECHWIHRQLIQNFRQKFTDENLNIRIKMGVESFDEAFREQVLDKGMVGVKPEDIAFYADDICLLQGLTGQTEESMKNDIETGLKYFKRVNVNIMTPNSKHIKPDYEVIDVFKNKIFPLYNQNPKVEILMTNTDWGLGEKL